MSHIAAALAKSKGKQVATPAAGTPAAPAVVAPPVATARPALQAAVAAAAAAAAPPAPAVTAPKKKAPAWMLVAAGVGLPVLAGLGWLLLRPVDTPPPGPKPAPVHPVVAPAPSPPVVTAPAPKPESTIPAPVAVTSVAPATNPTVGTNPPAPAGTNPSPAAGPSDQSDAVARLPITASRQGAKPTVMIGGKVYRPGEPVTDQLTLQAVEPGRVLFVDLAGRVYERRL